MSSSSSSPIRVLLVGATGSLGQELAKGLLHSRFQGRIALSIIARAGKAGDNSARQQQLNALQAAGTALIERDVETSSHEQLVEALTGFDVVVSALNVTQAVSGELPLIAAAKAAGVGWFIPSEFGFDIDAIAAAGPLEQCALPVLAVKLNKRKVLEQSGMDYTYVLTSVFLEWFLTTGKPSLLGHDPVHYTINVPSSLDCRISTIALPDIAYALGDAIVTGRGRNTTLRLAASALSYRELVTLVERVSGRKWTVVIKSQAEYDEAIQKAPNDIYARFGALVAAQHGCHWPVESSYNYKHGLPVQTVEEYAQQVVPK